MATKRELTAKQRRFVQEFGVDLNAHRAAIRAGYSKKTARQIGAENLSKPYILAEIKAAMRETEESIGLSKEAVIKGLIEITDRCMQAVPVFDTKGQPTGEFRFNAAGAVRALELLGKSIGMFNPKLCVDIKDPVTINHVSDGLTDEQRKLMDEVYRDSEEFKK